MSSVEVFEVFKWIGELEGRTTFAELATLPKFLFSRCFKTYFSEPNDTHCSLYLWPPSLYRCQSEFLEHATYSYPVKMRCKGPSLISRYKEKEAT